MPELTDDGFPTSAPAALIEAYQAGKVPPGSAGANALRTLAGGLVSLPPNPYRDPATVIVGPAPPRVPAPLIDPAGPSVPQPRATPVPVAGPTPPGAEGNQPGQSPPGGGIGGFLSDLNPFDDIGRGVLSAARAVLGPVADLIGATVGRLTAVAGALLEEALPSVTELALGIASRASGFLAFLADNLTDAADLGLNLAQGITVPLEALLELGGAMLSGALGKLLEALARGLELARSVLLAPPAMVRLI